MPNEREIIADEIERMMKSMSLLNGEDLGKATHEMGRFVYVHSSQVIAALRAKDREDGAREMREPSDFRVGRRVPRNVYRGDTPMFMAATEAEAAEMVVLLNAGCTALATTQGRETGGGVDG